MAHDTTIDGYYLNGNGVWTDSVNELIDKELLKNISMENPSFSIQCSGSNVNINNIGNIIESEINKLKITNSYEMFNVSNYNLNMSSYGSGPINVTVNCTYKMTAGMEADLDSKVKEIVASVAPDNMNQSDKELAIHDWIVNNTRYDESYTIYDPYDTLIKHTGVCEGYSLLAQKMFTIAGIKSIVVEGTADGGSHAWNLVYIDNKWRHVDCTWDDPVSSSGDILNHDYYNLTDKEMSTSHSWDTTVYPNAM
jgi:transglutaminase/protease-like cytokinesis protein 3